MKQITNISSMKYLITLINFYSWMIPFLTTCKEINHWLRQIKILDRILSMNLYKFVGEISVGGNYKLDK